MKFRLIVVVLLAFFQSAAQDKYPTNYFRYPLDIKPSFSGRFADLRPNHFHSGLDFRTNQREGYPIYAVADGYISRLRVQTGGFGQAIYIDHPNGYTSVYAHLRAYAPQIAKTVKDFQYRLQSFEVDIPLTFSEIQVKKGDLIGWSGNTGSSGGPHLHFEIRDTQSEEPINPQLFGLTGSDPIKPEIKGVYLYKLNGQAFSEKVTKQYIPVKGLNGNYQALSNEPIVLNGETGFGLVAFDRNQIQGTAHGLHRIEMQLDGQTVYEANLERFSFDATKAINSHLDYPSLKNSGINIHKTFVEPGNPLQIYQAKNNGRISLEDESLHELTYIVSDVAGNQSSLTLKIKQGIPYQSSSFTEKGTVFKHDADNYFSNEEVRISIPKGTLYSDIDFEYASAPRIAGTFSKQHRIHRSRTPIHQTYQLAIKADLSLTAKLQEKALIVDAGGAAQGGTFKNGFVETEVKSFGTFFIKVDTLAPRITPVNINNGKAMTGISKMIFKIADNISGIGSFIGTIDGQWVLMEYDQKSATLWHQFDERTQPGKHVFELLVTDKKGNQSTFKASFTL